MWEISLSVIPFLNGLELIVYTLVLLLFPHS